MSELKEHFMKVGSTRPVLREDWIAKNLSWRILAYCERFASWFFFLFNTVALFRLVIEAAAVAVLIATLMSVFWDIQQRQIDRSVRVATMYAQIAQTLALPEGRGLSAVRTSVEILAQEGASMNGIDLSGASLSGARLRNAIFVDAKFRNTNLAGALLFGANLVGADLTGANLSDANLFQASVSSADLSGANLSYTGLAGTDLTDTNLRGADLSDTILLDANFRNANLTSTNFSGANFIGVNLNRANLSGADLRQARDLSQDMLQVACAESNNPPLLPQSWTWKNNPCH